MGRRALPVRGRRARRRAGVAAALVGVVVAGGIAANAWFGTRDATERTTDALQARRDELAQAEEDLAAARAQLADAEATLEDELATLDLRQGERDAAQSALDASTLLLADLDAQLQTAATDLEARRAQLDALVVCVVGVAEALNQAAVGDVQGLAVTVGGIEGTCAEAGAAL